MTGFNIALGFGSVPLYGQATAAPGVVGATATITTTFPTLPPVFDSGAARGANAAFVPLTGTTDAAEGAVIEVRHVAFDDATDAEGAAGDWQATGTASGGSWSAVLTAPRNDGTYYRAEARVQGSGAAPARMTNRFASGHVWALWGQSGHAKVFFEVPGNAADIYETIHQPGNVQYIHRSAPTTIVPVTEANKNSAPVTPGGVTFANALTRLRPGEKFLVVLHLKSGTSLADAMSSDAENPTGDRDWIEERDMHNTATANGGHVGVAAVLLWGASVSGYGAQMASNYMGGFTGRYEDGRLAAAAGVFNGNMTRLPVKVLYDGTTLDADGVDLSVDGFYDMRQTRAFYHAGGGASLDISGSSTDPASGGFATIADYPLALEQPRGQTGYDIALGAYRDWRTAKNPAVLDYEPGVWGAERDWANNDPVHTSASSPDGHMRRAAHSAFVVARATGLTSIPRPTLDRRYDEPTGAWCDMWIDGMDVTTERLRRGETPPTPTDPHHTEVLGWTINDRPASRAEIHTVTAQEVTEGHTAAAGTKVCRVWPVTGPFTFADKIAYGFESATGLWIQEDYSRRFHLDLLVADPGLPSGYPIPALLVAQQKFEFLPTTLATPDLFGATDARFSTDANNLLNTEEQFAVVFKGRWDGPDGGTQLIRLGTGNPVVKINNSDQWEIGNDGVDVAGPAAVAGAFVELHFIFDRTNGVMRITDGSTTLAENISTGLTGAFAKTGSINILKHPTSSPMRATVETVELYIGTTDTSGSPDLAVTGQAAAPFYAVTGAISLTQGTPTEGVA